MKRLLVIFIWLPTTLATILFTLSLQNFHHNFSSDNQSSFFDTFNNPWKAANSYQLYSSLPKVLGASTVNITGEDAIPVLVQQYLDKNQSPMAPYVNQLVKTARKYDVD